MNNQELYDKADLIRSQVEDLVRTKSPERAMSKATKLDSLCGELNELASDFVDELIETDTPEREADSTATLGMEPRG